MSCPSLLAVGSLALLAAGAGPALAQDGPSFDCAKASTWGERLVCSDPELARLDRNLQARFEAALAAAQAQTPAALLDLRATQRGWIKGRDDCWKGLYPNECVRANYLHREAQLVAGWSLEAPSWVTTYRCGSTAEIRVSYFDTEHPSVRIERGPETDVAVGEPGEEHTRYTSDLGSVFLVDADDAWLQWLGGAEEACSLKAD
ncbi:lysozyme inhibitor LprI family protein [Rubellimicrobium arenae]|uniref:lysozyme inhibitor LprI family protein n=1 Tax=Rubellimicrobium arenae TaxID=2817372 RepID=UPI001B30F956|nr:lysozyme inhibitor LprI family protein [Rubellimicrobium arenae]